MLSRARYLITTVMFVFLFLFLFQNCGKTNSSLLDGDGLRNIAPKEGLIPPELSNPPLLDDDGGSDDQLHGGGNGDGTEMPLGEFVGTMFTANINIDQNQIKYEVSIYEDDQAQKRVHSIIKVRRMGVITKKHDITTINPNESSRQFLSLTQQNIGKMIVSPRNIKLVRQIGGGFPRPQTTPIPLPVPIPHSIGSFAEQGTISLPGIHGGRDIPVQISVNYDYVCMVVDNCEILLRRWTGQ